MHSDRNLIESRLKRVLEERIRPAVYPESVPMEVGIWTAPDEPVPVAEGIAAPRTPISVGARWGAPWGTSWLTVSGVVPDGAGNGMSAADGSGGGPAGAGGSTLWDMARSLANLERGR